jgi:PAS domain S-box-containing protein
MVFIGLVVVVMTSGEGRRDHPPGGLPDLLESETGVEAQMQAIFNAMPHMIWSARADGQTDFYNDEWYRINGVPYASTDGENWSDVVHPDEKAEAHRRWESSIATGEPYEIEYRMQRNDGTWRWQLGRACPIRAPDGSIERWVGTCTDIHDLKEAQRGLMVVAAELTHRIKNMFAVVTAILTLGARSRGAEVKEFAQQTAARLDALARTQDLIQLGSTAAEMVQGRSSLHALVQALSAPHVGGRLGSIAIEGTDVDLSAKRTTAIVLVLHEMFTNAMKYGALSANEGMVCIHTQVSGDRLLLLWMERGGPRVNGPPTQKGFGTSLGDRIVHQQLGGTIALDWQAQGLVATIEVPLARLMD